MRTKWNSLTVIKLTHKPASTSHCKIKGLPSIWPALLPHMLTPGAMCLVWGDIRRLSSMPASLQAGQPFQQQQHFLQEHHLRRKPARTSANQPTLTIIANTCTCKAWFKGHSFGLCGARLFAGPFSQLLIWSSPYVRDSSAESLSPSITREEWEGLVLMVTPAALRTEPAHLLE